MDPEIDKTKDERHPPGAAQRALRELLDRKRLSLAAGWERLRQDQEIFEQLRREDALWNRLRRGFCWFAMVLLGAIMVVCSYILLNSSRFSGTVVTSAGVALFGDIVGLLVAVFRIVFNPSFISKLKATVEPRQFEGQTPDEAGDMDYEDNETLEAGSDSAD